MTYDYGFGDLENKLIELYKIQNKKLKEKLLQEKAEKRLFMLLANDSLVLDILLFNLSKNNLVPSSFFYSFDISSLY